MAWLFLVFPKQAGRNEYSNPRTDIPAFLTAVKTADCYERNAGLWDQRSAGMRRGSDMIKHSTQVRQRFSDKSSPVFAHNPYTFTQSVSIKSFPS
ncbi:hypothetical protein ROHU_031186 [Labeo rohita]|uniref:Uncharacterized protein n=1 Tax=Labeo rohita TaxID=84645 RepID=A0A498LRV3_LABRO|nr:hypothetical protein ROHU_031186 [Labeo rohita]